VIHRPFYFIQGLEPILQAGPFSASWLRAGKPEKVRTAHCLVVPLWLRVAGVQTGCGCLFRTLFLWLLSFGGAKESNSNTIIASEKFY
jgi:hypothetical protein